MENPSRMFPAKHHIFKDAKAVLLNSSAEPRVPLAIRASNFAALALLSLIVVPSITIRPSQLPYVLSIPFVLIAFYWVFQHIPAVSALYLALSFFLILWIAICENIVSIDNVFESHITARLQLGLRLKTFAKDNLQHQDKYREACCGDPLTWHYKPGSTYRAIYDCVACNQPFETTVDVTGYINRQYDMTNDRIDMFIAGDSVLEGAGTPGIVEFLNELMNSKIWSLSSNNYGPRQKVNSIVTYALPHLPKWVVIEFYAANDIADAAVTEGCASTGTFHCVFNIPERHRALFRHPVFSSMVDKARYVPNMWDEYVENSFTLAVTRLVADNLKAVGRAIVARADDEVNGTGHKTEPTQTNRFSLSEMSRPGVPEFVLPGKRSEWVQEGMQLTESQYDRLSDAIAKMEKPPIVILLYNPAAYEIYRDVFIPRDEESDEVSEFQRHALGDYADKNGWKFLDLTMSLHEEVMRKGFWIYGQHDRVHWSMKGTKVVASVLARELDRITKDVTLILSIAQSATH